MRMLTRSILLTILLAATVLVFSDGRRIEGADHGDAPALGSVMRNDAKLTDLFAFRDDGHLVLVLCVDPAIPPGVPSYTFQDDVTFEINVDNATDVSYADTSANAIYGGTVVNPENIHPAIKFTVTFPMGQPHLKIDGQRQNDGSVEMFTGLRDDPFIRGPRQGRNIAAIVLKMPLSWVVRDQSQILVWATSRVPQLPVPQADLAGRALRNMFPEGAMLNDLPPNQHMSALGQRPDVIIYDTSSDAVFPNGRRLADDVVDMVGDARVLGDDAPFPTSNDRRHTKTFPYLASPR